MRAYRRLRQAVARHEPLARRLRPVEAALRTRAKAAAGPVAARLAAFAGDPEERPSTPGLPAPRTIPYPEDVADAATLRAALAQTDLFAEAHEADGYLTAALERFRVTMAMLPELAPQARVLELGANPYFVTRLLRQRGIDVRAANWFGTTEAWGPVASQTVTESGVPHTYEFDHFNVERDRFPYPDHTFDLVLFCEILEHLPCDPTHTLMEIYRVLKPGGSMLLTTPNAARLENLVKVQRGENMYEELSGYGVYGRHNREYTIPELREFLLGCGFVIDDAFAVDVWLNPEPPTFGPGIEIEHRGENIFLLAHPGERPRWFYPRWLYQSVHGYRRVVRPDLVVGTNCDVQAVGLHELEDFGGRPGRWTNPALTTVVTVSTAGAGQARLRVEGRSPKLGGRAEIFAEVAGAKVSWTIPCDGAEFSLSHSIEVPAGEQPVQLWTDRSGPDGPDGRTVGFVVHRVALASGQPGG